MHHARALLIGLFLLAMPTFGYASVITLLGQGDPTDGRSFVVGVEYVVILTVDPTTNVVVSMDMNPPLFGYFSINMPLAETYPFGDVTLPSGSSVSSDISGD
jgi:hypothetical protein